MTDIEGFCDHLPLTYPIKETKEQKAIEELIHQRWDCKLVQPLWK